MMNLKKKRVFFCADLETDHFNAIKLSYWMEQKCVVCWFFCGAEVVNLLLPKYDELVSFDQDGMKLMLKVMHTRIKTYLQFISVIFVQLSLSQTYWKRLRSSSSTAHTNCKYYCGDIKYRCICNW